MLIPHHDNTLLAEFMMDSCSVVCSSSQIEEQQPSSKDGICKAELEGQRAGLVAGMMLSTGMSMALPWR